jgi:acetyltransferase-like isoleucine patch superfamily enzyme
MGDDVAFGAHAILLAPSLIELGSRVYVGRDFHLESNLVAGDDILISSRVAFVGNDHSFDSADQTVFNQGRSAPATVVLEGDNLIGFGTIIVGTVTIGHGCIVGAGSVVTCDLPPESICAGVPAKVLRQRERR